MPNYCNNRITFSVEYEMHRHLLDELEQEIKTKNQFLNVIRPMPEEYNEGEKWYDWRCENWGTKWDMDYDVTRLDDALIINGTSAWSPPEDALKYYQENNPNISINCLYFEEGVGFCGQTIYEPGIITEQHIDDIYSLNKDEWLRNHTELDDWVCEFMEDYWEREEEEEGEPDDPIIPESSDIGGLDKE